MTKNSFKKMLDSSPATKILKDAEKQKENLEKEELKKLSDFIDICYNVYIDGEYKTGTKSGNIIGERIRWLLKKSKMTVVELAKETGISRSRLQSYLSKNCYETTRKLESGKHNILPKPCNLLKILEVFNCHVDDFIHSPKDIKIWKRDYEEGYYLPFDLSEGLHQQYEAFKNYITAQLKFPFSYLIDNVEVPMPEKIREILSQQILHAFEAVDVLLQYDSKTNSAKARYLMSEIEAE